MTDAPLAGQYGYRAALVGGVTVYGCCVPTILEAAGESWLDNGWAEVQFRRPTYPGDEMTVRATVEGDAWSLSADKASGDTCVRGQFGLGEAPWLGLLERSSRLAGDPEPTEREWLTLENAPVGGDLLTLPVNISHDDARQIATKQLRATNPLFTGERPLIHPATIARQMMTLLTYSYEYGRPSIHVSTHIQHLGRVESASRCCSPGTS